MNIIRNIYICQRVTWICIRFTCQGSSMLLFMPCIINSQCKLKFSIIFCLFCVFIWYRKVTQRESRNYKWVWHKRRRCWNLGNIILLSSNYPVIHNLYIRFPISICFPFFFFIVLYFFLLLVITIILLGKISD